ncbi:MAG: hypothetical protein ACLQVL_29360 [Terriglobia bacterium]
MNIPALSATEIAIIIAVGVIVVAGIVGLFVFRNRRTKRLRTQFGGAEYDRALAGGGSRQHAEARLEGRNDRIESLHIQPLAPGDRARFAESWRSVQGRFVDSPGGAVTDADQLLRDVMSTRGYPVADFEQRAADVSVDHPLVIDNYRKAHEIAVRQGLGHASTEDLRQAMIHFRTLFEDLVGEPGLAHARAASA